jgi:hypothetical protein
MQSYYMLEFDSDEPHKKYKKNNHNTPAYQHRILVTETT